MKIYYVWIADGSADDGRRAWIIKASNETEACLAAPILRYEWFTDVHAYQMFKKHGQRVERIQG